MTLLTAGFPYTNGRTLGNDGFLIRGVTSGGCWIGFQTKLTRGSNWRGCYNNHSPKNTVVQRYSRINSGRFHRKKTRNLRKFFCFSWNILFMDNGLFCKKPLKIVS